MQLEDMTPFIMIMQSQHQGLSALLQKQFCAEHAMLAEIGAENAHWIVDTIVSLCLVYPRVTFHFDAPSSSPEETPLYLRPTVKQENAKGVDAPLRVLAPSVLYEPVE